MLSMWLTYVGMKSNKYAIEVLYLNTQVQDRIPYFGK